MHSENNIPPLSNPNDSFWIISHYNIRWRVYKSSSHIVKLCNQQDMEFIHVQL